MSIRPIKNKSGTKYESRLLLDGASESRTFVTLAEAKAWALQTKAKAGRGEYSPKSDIRSYSMTLHAALSKYVDDVTRDKKWPEVESNRAKRLQRHALAKKKLINITPEDIFRYRNERLDAGKAANTIRLEMVLLSQVFDAAIFWQMPKLLSPLLGVKKPKLPQPSNRRFEPDST